MVDQWGGLVEKSRKWLKEQTAAQDLKVGRKGLMDWARDQASKLVIHRTLWWRLKRTYSDLQVRTSKVDPLQVAEPDSAFGRILRFVPRL
jgi:hypothetical protein